eukprot:5655507-Prymnesium_polylepis.1
MAVAPPHAFSENRATRSRLFAMGPFCPANGCHGAVRRASRAAAAPHVRHAHGHARHHCACLRPVAAIAKLPE